MGSFLIYPLDKNPKQEAKVGENQMADFSFLEFPEDSDQHQDISYILEDYLKHIVNKKLRLYKQYIHTSGDKQGQSLYSHVLDLISFTDRLCSVIRLTDDEMRCVFLALTD